MIKFSKNADLFESDLLISFASIGSSGIFASTLFHLKNDFENIGFFYSTNYSAVATNNPLKHTPTYNGELYFNHSKKILIMNIFGIPKFSEDKFFDELIELQSSYKMKRIIFFSGISRSFLNDEELKNKFVDVYFLTNENSEFLEKSGMKSFEKLVKMEKKEKEFEEVNFIEGCGKTKDFVKYLIKKKKLFSYLFAFSDNYLDMNAGLALYLRLGNLLGLVQDDKKVCKTYDDTSSKQEELLLQLGAIEVWKAFIKN